MMKWFLSVFVLRRLRQNLQGVGLLLISVALAVSVFLALTQASRASIASLQRSGALLKGVAKVQIKARELYFSPQQLVGSLRHLSEQFSVVGLLEIHGELLCGGGRGSAIKVRVSGIDPSELPTPLTAGDGSLAFASPDIIAICSEGPVQIEASGREFGLEIGALKGGAEELPEKTILVDLPQLQDALGMPGKVSSIALIARGTQEVRDFRGEISLPSGFYVEDQATLKSRSERLLAAFRFNINAMMVIALLASAFAIFNAAQLSAQSFRHEFIVLLTLGASRALCFGIILVEAIVVGLFGSLLGVSLCAPLTRAVVSIFMGSAESLYGVQSSEVPLLAQPDLIFFALIVGCGISALGSVYPAWLASGISLSQGSKRSVVIEVRNPWAQSRGAAVAIVVGSLCVAAAFYFKVAFYGHLAALSLVAFMYCASATVLRLCTEWFGRLAFGFGPSGCLALSNMRSSASFAAVSVTTTAISISLLIGLGVMVGSFRSTLENWIEYSIRADVFLKARGPAEKGRAQFLPAEVYQKVIGLKGVEAVARFSSFEGSVNGAPVVISGSDFVSLPRARNFYIIAGDFDATKLEREPFAIISESAARRLNLAPSAKINVEGVPFGVLGVYEDFTAEEGAVLVGFENFHRAFYPLQPPDAIVQTMAVYLQHQGMAADFSPMFSNLPVEITLNNELRSQITSIFDRTFLITKVMRAIVVIICGIGFIVSILQLLWERRRELRTLEVLGASPKEVRRAVLMEAVMLAVPGLALGVTAGILLALILIKVINPLSFGWSIKTVFHFSDLILPVLIVFGWNFILALIPVTRVSSFSKGATVTNE